ncbi:MAG: alpha/beta-type small acid-soluble spore protein [Bacillota bacterium]|jgi:small acid-soluble spore protein A (major alpha-type SASP)|nr:alpha/beta-type small acid-soluble spore protein [Bacillota bacterium]MDD3297826.1 alpha/beta-type small acid-soluble spore protein [Bacillota bacterium]MDD3851126.1 alpha/beta-type small acid-soluble spore protein [Bacillota bacterium]MDD4706949.1 alpha/beta-type small acid-soluble spore protein [Bacillota bacterium]
MAAGQQTPGRKLVQEAHPALDNMKYEIASQFNLPVHQSSEDYWGNLTAKDCGRVGGEMVKRMITMAENQLSGK